MPRQQPMNTSATHLVTEVEETDGKTAEDDREVQP
jgi:hypothetical protein